ncbi:hypothetical protein QQF64_028067 [Cirrhinus molitorella]|uniref:Uncharacterized protein n=1 Tax=Cirrhinus molitorella TaxID=172907 RepID=A0ABR3N5J6_9TELE
MSPESHDQPPLHKQRGSEEPANREPGFRHTPFKHVTMSVCGALTCRSSRRISVRYAKHSMSPASRYRTKTELSKTRTHTSEL